MITIQILQNTKLIILAIAPTGAIETVDVDIDSLNVQQDPDTVPVWDDDQIELFSSFDIAEMGKVLFDSIDTGREIHQFLKSVDLLDDQSEADLDPMAHMNQLDHVKAVMGMLERSYDSVLESGGDENDAVYTVKMSAAALINTYQYPSYPILCGAVNLLAKRELETHG